MTREEFDKFKWQESTIVSYRGAEYGVVSINFYEALLGIILGGATGDDSADDLIWVRCESVEVVK
jgi:hypothetical protein